MKRIMTVMLAVIYITTGTISVMAGEPENNDAQKKESVSDSVKVQTSENTDEDRPKENSWRYSNGELIPQEDDATSNARAVTNAWKKVNGQFVNSLGKPIPGAKKKGMDISEYQGTINWDTVKNRSDIDFVIIRSSYGSGYKDRKWEYNVKECERLGIPYGVYIYSTATTVSAVEKEAENVKKMLEGHQPTYPVYFDMEENSVLNLGSSTIGKLANTFCSKISGAGYKVGIYASLYWWNSILTDRVFKNESWSKWVAQYSASCQYQSKYDMWQCTSSGKVNGVSTNVDINFWMSDEPVINQDADQVMVSDENIITYTSHMQSYGWMGEKANNTAAGILNGGKRMEAIKLHLTGELAEKYDIYYRVHTQTFGWLDWGKNGEPSGTKDYAKRIEAVQVKVVPKGNPAPGATSIAFKEAKIAYKTHVQTYGWMSKVHDGETAGTSGKAKRMEALNIAMVDSSYNKEISYRTHVQTYGWQKWVNGGKNSGTEGKAKRLEAIQIELKDSLADQYDIYYRKYRKNIYKEVR